MFKLLMPTVVEVEKKEDNSYGKYVIEPLERGYGTTLGNVLRRTMLSSIPGTAISFVKIKGATHEFMTLDGIKEDVSDIILNLKAIKIINEERNEKKKYAFVDAKGKGVVRAGDIQVGDKLKIANPDLVIATLGKDDAEFHAEFIITDGYGFRNATNDSEVKDYIAIDSIYSPISRVTPTIENSRVGEETDYDKLILEIYTDGTVNPGDVISMAGKIISEQMVIFANYTEKSEANNPFIPEDEEEKRRNEIKTWSIKETGLSVPLKTILEAVGIKTIGDLTKKSAKELLQIKNIGESKVIKIKEELEELGLALKEDEE